VRGEGPDDVTAPDGTDVPRWVCSRRKSERSRIAAATAAGLSPLLTASMKSARCHGVARLSL